MKATEFYQFPYPECDPPLVKDSSQISQMAQLAEAIDAEVERIITLAEDVLTTPASARVITSAAVATTDVQVMPFFNSVVFNNSNWPSPLGPGNGNLSVPEDGWYMVGAHAATDSATAMQVNIRLTRNGLPASSWSNPGAPYSTIFQLPALGTVPMQLNTDDSLNIELRHNAAGGTAWNYRPHLWAWKLITV